MRPDCQCRAWFICKYSWLGRLLRRHSLEFQPVPYEVVLASREEWRERCQKLEDAMLEMRGHQCSSTGIDICSQMWYQDIIDEALGMDEK